MKVFFDGFEEKRVALQKPVKTSVREINERRIFIIRLKDSRRNVAEGEAAPLDGFSRESENETRELLENLRGADFPSRDFSSLKNFEEILSVKFENFPAAIFAFEQAFVKLAVKNGELPDDEHIGFMRRKIGSFSETRIKTNFLVSFPCENFEQKIENAVKKGCDVVKIKLVGKNELPAAGFLRKFPNVKFRFDPNGAWNYDEAVKMLKILNETNSDYTEDPTNDLRANIDLAREFSVAIDLTAKTYDDYLFALESGVKNFVVKPSFFGGFVKLSNFISRAAKNNARVIVSSAFEGKTARGFVAFFATLLPEETHGLSADCAADEVSFSASFSSFDFSERAENE